MEHYLVSADIPDPDPDLDEEAHIQELLRNLRLREFDADPSFARNRPPVVP